MISERQNRFYWGLWKKAVKALMRGREAFTREEENRRRHEVHVRVCGRDCSHCDFTNGEFDLVIAEMCRIADPDRVNASTLQRSNVAEARRRRAYFGLRGLMRRLRLGEEYVNAISRRMFLGLEVNDLAACELQKLIIALREHERRNAA